MDDDLRANPVIDRLRQALEVTTDVDLGAAFGHGSSTVGAWRSRNRVPYAECVNVAIRKGLSLDWLLLGIGEPAPAAGVADDSRTSYQVVDREPRFARLTGFLRHWFEHSDEDGKAWLEMQLARAVPEYAQWVARRKG